MHLSNKIVKKISIFHTTFHFWYQLTYAKILAKTNWWNFKPFLARWLKSCKIYPLRLIHQPTNQAALQQCTKKKINFSAIRVKINTFLQPRKKKESTHLILPHQQQHSGRTNSKSQLPRLANWSGDDDDDNDADGNRAFNFLPSESKSPLVRAGCLLGKRRRMVSHKFCRCWTRLGGSGSGRRRQMRGCWMARDVRSDKHVVVLLISNFHQVSPSYSVVGCWRCG